MESHPLTAPHGRDNYILQLAAGVLSGNTAVVAVDYRALGPIKECLSGINPSYRYTKLQQLTCFYSPHPFPHLNPHPPHALSPSSPFFSILLLIMNPFNQDIDSSDHSASLNFINRMVFLNCTNQDYSLQISCGLQ